MRNKLKTLAVMLMLATNFVAESVQANTATVSWYGPGLQGNPMANGERFDMNDPTVVAHKKLPFGTIIAFNNPENDCSAILIVQDRGPYIDGRQFDVSKAAADKLCFRETGVTKLTFRIIGQVE